MAALVEMLLVSLSGLVSLLSNRSTHRLAVFVAWLVFRVVGYRRRVIEENLGASFPELDPAARRALQQSVEVHLAETLLEFLRMPRFAARGFDEVSFTGLEHYRAALAQGRGVLCLAGHLGSFEQTAAAVAHAIHPTKLWLVVKPFSPGVDRFVTRARRLGGVDVIPAEGALPVILAALKRQEAVAIVLDQHAPGQTGVPVQFFGRTAQALTALALVAARSRAPVIAAFGHRREDGHHVLEVLPEIQMERRARLAETLVHMTQIYTRVLETAIREHPEQWFWSHRRWKPGPPPAAESASSSASAAVADGP